MPRPQAAPSALSFAMLFALLLAACSAQPAPQPARVVEPRVTQAPAIRGDGPLRRAMLAAHDAARAAVGEAPLVWDETLTADAAGYAREMARTGRFAHAEQPQGRAREGENLWTGTRDAYAYGEMVAAWIAERRDFVNGPAPAFSRTGRWEDVAHYTQIVWRGTTRIGCALAGGRRDDFLVCRYAPVGNVVGQRAL